MLCPADTNTNKKDLLSQVSFVWWERVDSKGSALRARKLADPIMFGFAECGSNPQQLSHKKQKRQPI